MNAPNLDHMWESFVHIGSVEYVRVYGYLDVLRAQVAPVIADLRSAGLVDWYCLLVHGADEGVPCGPADRDCYWHVRVSLAEGVSGDDLKRRLPRAWQWTQPMGRQNTDSITGVTADALRDQDISLAWRIIGEQSEWWLRMIDCYRPNMPSRALCPDILLYLHLLTNMTQLLPPMEDEHLEAECRRRGFACRVCGSRDVGAPARP